MVTILFLCPHNAAKSVLAAAYFQQAAEARGLPFQAASAGTDPAPTVSPAVVALLREEGIDVANYTPRPLTATLLATAQQVVSLGCDLSDLVPPETVVRSWDDVPAPSLALEAAQEAIRGHVARLIDELAGSNGGMP